MNILVLSDRYPEFGAGGAGTMAHRLSRMYQSSGHEIQVATTRGGSTDERPSDSTPVETEVDGVPVTAFPTIADERFRYHYTIYNPRVLKPFRQWLDSLNDWVDAVHVHNVHEFLSYHILRTVRQSTEGRTVLTYHDTMSFSFGKLSHFVEPDPSTEGEIESEQYRFSVLDQIKQAKKRYNPLRNPLAKRYLGKYVDANVSISHELAESLRANDVPVTDVVHNGVDTDRYASANPEEFRERYDTLDPQFVFFAGRISDKKGGLRLAKAIAESESRPQLVVSGARDEYVRSLQDRVPKIADQIHNLGWVDESLMPAAFAAATVVATPSIYLDPFILVNLEAMAAGTPVITTCFGGAKEVVEDGRTGFVINPFDTSEFSNKIDLLCTDLELRRSLGGSAERHARKNFNIHTTAEKYLHLMER